MKKTVVRKAPVTGLVNLHAWNEITDYPDIMALAHTCKHLKSTIYPIIFKAWACYSKDSSSDNLSNLSKNQLRKLAKKNALPKKDSACYFLPKVPERCRKTNFHPDTFASLLGPTLSPRFYIVRGDKHMIPDALSHVQYLSIPFIEGVKPCSDWLSTYLPQMRALKDVTICLTTPLTTEKLWDRYGIDVAEDFSRVIRLLSHHDSALTVHTYLRLLFNEKEWCLKYFKRFENEWFD